MFTEAFFKNTLFEVAVAVAIAFFYIKLTAKDDRNLTKDLFRVACLVFLSKSVVFYVTQDGKNNTMAEPFFN